MRLSTKGRYAVMAMTDLAVNADGRPISLADISERQQISLSYLEQLFARLRKAGLVKSARGPGGGYALARPSDSLFVSEIVLAVDEPKATRCEMTSNKLGANKRLAAMGKDQAAREIGCMPGGGRCLTHNLWEDLGGAIHDYLSQVSLRDVVEKRTRKKPNLVQPQLVEAYEVLPDILYLDHAATSPLRPQAREAFLRAADIGGNASSIHSLGRKVKLLLEEARVDILQDIGAVGSGGLVFTSGGTEANALALRQAEAFDYIVVSAGEHDSIYGATGGLSKPVVMAPLTPLGEINLAALEGLLMTNQGRPFVCVMLANNETGVINDVAAVGRQVHAHGGWLHVDVVQALGKISIDFSTLAADSFSISAHKIGGGQGVGALIYDRDRVLKPLITGSGQELGLRAGTENIAGIAAFAAAMKACQPLDPAVIAAQAGVEAALKQAGVTILGTEATRVPGLIYLAQPKWASSLQLIHMDLSGICVSSGSACSSGKVKESRVVAAMGYPELASGVLRVSAGWTTKADDISRFYDVWSKGYAAFSKRHMIEVA